VCDAQSRRLISRSDDDLMRMVQSVFDRFTEGTPDLRPEPVREDVNELNASLDENVNDGVHRTGPRRPHQTTRR
jgi:putative glutathione S-transferase